MTANNEVVHATCTIGPNKKRPILVDFPVDTEEIFVNSPCKGCLWRFVVPFEVNEVFEEFIRKKVHILTLDIDTARAYHAYLLSKDDADAIGRENSGAMAPYQGLRITRFPFRDNGIMCQTVNK